MPSKNSMGDYKEQHGLHSTNEVDSEQDSLDQQSEHEGQDVLEPSNKGIEALNNDISRGSSENLECAVGDWRNERLQDWNISTQGNENQDHGGSTAQRWGMRLCVYESSEERPSLITLISGDIESPSHITKGVIVEDQEVLNKFSSFAIKKRGGRPRKMKKFRFFDIKIRRSQNKANISKKQKSKGGLKIKISQPKNQHNQLVDKV